MRTIDLNADLGEGFGHYRVPSDEAVLDLVTSVNVACGFHAGDPVVMRETVERAAARGVTIGAHPGYPDLLGFGRRELGATPPEIEAYVVAQVGALAGVCAAAGTTLRYVKPHGALYNRAVHDRAAADAIARAVLGVDRGLVLLGLGGSQLVAAARTLGLRTADEAFVDRGYAPGGSLVPRSQPGALLDDPDACAVRAVRMVTAGRVTDVAGQEIELHADSLCVHGDGPRAPDLLRAVRAGLDAAGVRLAPFA